MQWKKQEIVEGTFATFTGRNTWKANIDFTNGERYENAHVIWLDQMSVEAGNPYAAKCTVKTMDEFQALMDSQTYLPFVVAKAKPRKEGESRSTDHFVAIVKAWPTGHLFAKEESKYPPEIELRVLGYIGGDLGWQALRESSMQEAAMQEAA